MSSTQEWNSTHYDDKLSFVSEYGKDVVQLLNPKVGEKIFDLGCGTADLSNEIKKFGSDVTGMDLSIEMIERAKSKYPDISFFVGNAVDFKMDEMYDAVFSNATLHWVKECRSSVRSIWNILNSGGRFVAEFGGKGNVQTIVKAIKEVLLEEKGLDADELNPWYFPSIAEYSSILEEQGFRVTYAIHFDRPTQLTDGEIGLHHWLSGFAESFFHTYSEEEKKCAFEKIAEKAKSELFHDGHWYADYKRLRVEAVKP